MNVENPNSILGESKTKLCYVTQVKFQVLVLLY